MDLLKSIKENYLLFSAIIFVILLLMYAFLYKKQTKSETKEEDQLKTQKDKMITYTFYLILGLLGIYALYLIYIKYVKSGTISMVGGGNQKAELVSNVKISGEDVDIGFMD